LLGHRRLISFLGRIPPIPNVQNNCTVHPLPKPVGQKKLFVHFLKVTIFLLDEFFQLLPKQPLCEDFSPLSCGSVLRYPQGKALPLLPDIKEVETNGGLTYR